MTSTLKFAAAALCAAAVASAQSPAASESIDVAGGKITIKYNAPKVNGREGKLFGDGGRISSDPNYPIWRAGANSATKFHTDVDLTVGTNTVPKGDYTLYVNVADPKAWVLIINKQTGQWGLSYDKGQDVAHATMTMTKPAAMIENLKYTFADQGNGKVQLSLGWEDFSGAVVMKAK